MKCKIPLHYISGASFRRGGKGRTKQETNTITLHFWGILPLKRKKSPSQRKRYHYITFLGHPSALNAPGKPQRIMDTITLHFWGILPPRALLPIRLRKSIPLHYISGASFRQSLLSHPDDFNNTITLHFWGILPQQKTGA